MKIAIYKNNKWIGNVMLKSGRILASGSIPVIYNLLLDMKTTKPQTNADLIKNLPKLLHDNKSEFTAKITDPAESAQQIPPKGEAKRSRVNPNTMNAPDNFVQEQYLSPRRHW